jgi:hypothetical protein
MPSFQGVAVCVMQGGSVPCKQQLWSSRRRSSVWRQGDSYSGGNVGGGEE